MDHPDHSFFVYESVDPARNGGREEIVPAVVLSFRKDTTLPPNTHHVVGRNTYRATVGSTRRTAFIRFEDDLQGGGQLVPNNVTIYGASYFPSLGAREITIGDGGEPEAGHCEVRPFRLPFRPARRIPA